MFFFLTNIKGIAHLEIEKNIFLLIKLVTLILFGTTSQSFKKIILVGFEIYAKVVCA